MAGIFDMLSQRARRAEIYSTSDYWNGKARDLEGSAASMWPNQHLNALYHEEQTVRLDELLGDLAGNDVLDIGCGTGRMSRYLADKGGRVTGIDFADDALQIARQESRSQDIRYRCQSVLTLEDREAYDLVVSWGVLTIGCRTSTELAEAFRRLATALRPGGRLILMEPVHASFLHRVLSLSEPGFVKTMQDAGFSADKVEHFHFWPARLALAYIRWPRWMTRWVYAIGQFCLVSMFRQRRFGDYQLYTARLEAEG